ncbi:MAG: UvrB/UvrC motif-containing protein [Candidatus Kerfeldbacteria bacterium]|nr:UvrB/UvrC motif-containing protein [Candidatus Kerfeldbacteria bacterium]
MYWANFLHIYQPPTQKAFWIKKIANESYRVLIRGLKANRRAKITLNVNAGLTELFARHGGRDIITDLAGLAKRGQVEFTGSAKYHPFLPLIPAGEIQRQIELNTATNKKFFGTVYQPKGFFPPEMGYSRKVADVARSLGFTWIVIDELAHTGTMDDTRWDTLYTLKGAEDFVVFFRDRNTSFRILSAEVGISIYSKGMLIKLLGDRLRSDEYLLTAMDGETFGHHRPGLDLLLFELYTVPELKPVTLTELTTTVVERTPVEPLDSSWALMKKDLEQKTPFARWNDEQNEIHKMQWRLTALAIASVAKLDPTHKDYPNVRAALDRSLHSDQYWWASASPWWSIEMIEAGAKELRDVVQANPTADGGQKAEAQRLYQDIVFTAFDWQRSDKIHELARASDEDITQRITTELPFIPVEEFTGIVKNLERQMLTAAKNKEYERAAQIRDRIRELEEKKDQITTKH